MVLYNLAVAVAAFCSSMIKSCPAMAGIGYTLNSLTDGLGLAQTVSQPGYRQPMLSVLNSYMWLAKLPV
jgi:hypothetical protein